MRWPWSRRREQRAADTAEAVAQVAEAAEAVQRAQRRLDDAKRMEPRVNRLLAQLQQLGDPDEFARRLAMTFRDRR